MRKFKEIVSFVNTEFVLYEGTVVKYPHVKQYMPGTVVELNDDIIKETDSFSESVLGVVINSNKHVSEVAISGVVKCLCKKGRYKKGDFLMPCEIFGTGRKYIQHSSHYSIPLEFCINDAFAQVLEDIDLRTMYIGAVTVKLLKED